MKRMRERSLAAKLETRHERVLVSFGSQSLMHTHLHVLARYVSGAFVVPVPAPTRRYTFTR